MLRIAKESFKVKMYCLAKNDEVQENNGIVNNLFDLFSFMFVLDRIKLQLKSR